MATPTVKSITNPNNPITGVAGATLNGLASGALALDSTVQSNVAGDGKGEGYPLVDMHLHLSSMTVSAGGIVDGWFLTALDGSLYEQGGSSVTPQRSPDFSFPIVAQTAAVDVDQRDIRPPICAAFKLLVRNNALGAAMPADTSGYIKLFYHTEEIPSV